MGCNCKDFKKTDLVRDKEVLGHINQVREEKEKAESEKREVERKAREERKRRKDEGNDSDRSADSIVEEVIEMIKDNGNKGAPAHKEPNLSESSSSDVTTSDDSTSKSSADSSKGSSEAQTSKTSTESDANHPVEAVDHVPANVEPEKSKSNPVVSRPGKKSNKRRRMMSESESGDSDSDIPLSRARAKRNRKQPRKLDDSFSGCEFDENHSDVEDSLPSKRGRKNGKKAAKKIKIVGKKITETWCIEKEAAKNPNKKRRTKEKWTNVVPNEDFESDEDIPVSKKGKSSRNKPPKNGNKDGDRPKRAKKVSYAESDDEF